MEPHSEAVIIERGLCMPPEVADSELMRECWEWTVDGASHFTEADIPMLTLLVHWWAVARQCSANLGSASGGVVTKVDTPMGPRQDPDIRTLQLATNQVRQLSSELGVGPLARTRMGLMKIATASMAADLPDKIFRMLDSHNGD
jgi:phage terminase small subunit